MGRPWLINSDRDMAITRIDGLSRSPFIPELKEEITRQYPVSPQYEKGEQLAKRKRERDRQMPVMQLCARMLAIMALLVAMTTGVHAAPERANPILSLQAARVGPYDVRTTVNFLPHAENMAVCVGLAGEQYRARWGCQFVSDKDTMSVTIVWTDVPYEDYAIDVGLMRAHRPSNTDRKITQTFRRAFGVVKL